MTSLRQYKKYVARIEELTKYLYEKQFFFLLESVLKLFICKMFVHNFL